MASSSATPDSGLLPVRRIPVTEQRSWQILRTHFALTEGFSLVLLVAPDEWTLFQLRAHIDEVLPRGETVRDVGFEPLFPPDVLAQDLMGHALPPGSPPNVWVHIPAPAVPPRDPELHPWLDAFNYLNRHRNAFTRAIPGALILAGTPETIYAFQDAAPDFHSIRATQLAFDLAPILPGYDEHPSQQRKRLTLYRRSLVKAFARYEELALDHFAAADQAAPDIWDLFVHPACSTRHVSPEDIDADEQRRLVEGDTFQPKYPTQELLALLGREDHRRTVLLADPGMGKSTLIQSLIAFLASGRSFIGAPALVGLVPVPLILRDIVPLLPPGQPDQWTWPALLTALIEKFRREENAPLLLEAYRDHRDEFKTLITTSPKVFFLIDGLDEIGDLTKRRAIVKAIQEGIRSVSKEARWLITSRVIGYEEARADMVVEHTYLPLSNRNSTIWQCAVVDHETIHANAALLAEWKEFAVDKRDSMDGAESSWVDAAANDGVPLPSETTSELNPTGHSEFTIFASCKIAHRIYLSPFDNRRQDAFTQRWFHHRHARDLSQELLREVRQHGHEGVRIVSRVPNLLCMMNMLKRSGKPLPDGRHALYEEIAKAYLGGIDSAYRMNRALGHECPFSPDQRRRMLSLVAMHMQQRRVASAPPPGEEAELHNEPLANDQEGGVVISHEALHALLDDWINDLQKRSQLNDPRAPQVLLDELLVHIARRSGLLIPRGVDSQGRELFAFTHLSFLEFFAACHVRQQLEYQTEMDAAEFKALKVKRLWSAEDYQRQYPRGQYPVTPADLPGYAANPLWHEVLVLLLEAHSDSDQAQQRDALLEAIFPALYAELPPPVPIEEPIMPIESVDLAVKVAWDRDLRLTDEVLDGWWLRLWAGRLLLSRRTAWPVARKLLHNPDGHNRVLDQLVTAWRYCMLEEDDGPGSAPRLRSEFDHWDWSHLDLSGCATLQSECLRQFARLTHLKVLDIIGCKALIETSALINCTYLEGLSLAECTGLRGREAWRGIEGMEWLKTLVLAGCTGLEDTTALMGCASLDGLSLRDCTGLRGTDALNGISSLRQLRDLNLDGCFGLTDTTPLANCSMLEGLSLRDCTSLQGIAAIQGISSLKHLKKLFLDGCTGLTETTLLANCSALEVVWLCRCTGLIGREAIRGLGGLKQLIHVNLYGCTGLTEGDVGWLRAQLGPKCRIQWP